MRGESAGDRPCRRRGEPHERTGRRTLVDGRTASVPTFSGKVDPVQDRPSLALPEVRRRRPGPSRRRRRDWRAQCLGLRHLSPHPGRGRHCGGVPRRDQPRRGVAPAAEDGSGTDRARRRHRGRSAGSRDRGRGPHLRREGAVPFARAGARRSAGGRRPMERQLRTRQSRGGAALHARPRRQALCGEPQLCVVGAGHAVVAGRGDRRAPAAGPRLPRATGGPGGRRRTAGPGCTRAHPATNAWPDSQLPSRPTRGISTSSD